MDITVLGWASCLALPLLIRYVVLKRPLSKWKALLLVGILFVVEMVIVLALDDIFNGPFPAPRQHPALAFVALASYYILQREASWQSKTSSSVFGVTKK